MAAIALLLGFGACSAAAVFGFFGAYWFEYWLANTDEDARRGESAKKNGPRPGAG